ncbi:MAG: AAA+ family ATPase, partial [Caldilineaceae bacterium]|nr:AAA+ family ATPase [Caldilineaceae bacterium]
MAKSNRDRISDVMDTLRDGLGPYVLREYKMRYKAGGYLAEIEDVLNTNAYTPPQLPDEAAALAGIDIHGWLNLIWRRWNEVFSRTLGYAERNYVSELMTARNDWAHQQPFTNEDAYRVADTATRLLKSIGAPKQAAATEAGAKELLRLRFEAEQKRARKAPEAPDGIPTLTLKGLRPWRHVVKPHPDVASGRYIQAEFAADLAQVHKGEAD